MCPAFDDDDAKRIAQPPLPAAAPPHADGPAPAFTWVPVRSLSPRHRNRVATHLLELSAHDRYLRFGCPATDAQISRYVDTLDFDRDEVFGVFNRRLALIAMAHLAYAPAPQRAGRPAMAEFGVSVLGHARGRGFGARLFQHAVMHARNRGMQTLFIHALTENVAMLKIARAAGATVERDGSESEAWLKLPAETLGTRVSELFEQHAAEIDYRFKWHALHTHRFLEAMGRIKADASAHAGGVARE